MKRRSFLAATTVVVGLASTSWGAECLAVSPTRNKATPQLLPLDAGFSYAILKAYIGQSFGVYGGSGPGYVVKVDLISLEDRFLGSETDEFVARFRGPTNSRLDPGTYFFEHPNAGKFQLYIEPAGATKSGLDYRALFNLLLP